MKNITYSVRPPIVTVVGHVDHGKTTLLDKIRSTHIQVREAGGITQSIGASVVVTKEGKNITFIDTPGHAAFFGMRSRGVSACDIAILAVASDDGVKPQTLEALGFIKEAKIPFIVAFTKSDLPSSEVEIAKAQLEKEGVLFETRGGDTPCVAVSAKTGEGIDKLLEVVSLVAEVSEILGNDKGTLSAVVIETTKSKAGPLVSVVIKDGTVSVGDIICTEGITAKVRGLFDCNSKPVKQAYAGYPIQIIGFDKLPFVGSVLSHDQPPDDIKKPIESKKDYKAKLDEDEKPIIVKASTSGGLEAVLAGVPEKLVLVGSGIGGITENDVLSAKSSGAIVLAFEVKISPSIQKLAKTEAVPIFNFDIIYKLFEKMEELVKSDQKDVLGSAQIVAEFPFNSKRVVGCKIVMGVILKGNDLILKREDKEIGKTKVVSIKKGKQDVIQAKAGEECGMLIEPQLDFRIGDVLVSLGK